MKAVLGESSEGREYPLCLPPSLRVETIVDIGGNVGGAAIWFHHHFPDARIVTYEPSPLAFQLLGENTATIDNIEIKSFGMADRDGRAELHVGKHHSAQSSLIRARRDR